MAVSSRNSEAAYNFNCTGVGPSVKRTNQPQEGAAGDKKFANHVGMIYWHDYDAFGRILARHFRFSSKNTMIFNTLAKW